MMNSQNNFIPTSAGNSFEILDLPNCIHLMENGRCRELSFKKCVGKNCRFCTIKDKTVLTKQKWSNRLNSLDEKRQREISDKYYGGKMPLKKS